MGVDMALNRFNFIGHEEKLMHKYPRKRPIQRISVYMFVLPKTSLMKFYKKYGKAVIDYLEMPYLMY